MKVVLQISLRSILQTCTESPVLEGPEFIGGSINISLLQTVHSSYMRQFSAWSYMLYMSKVLGVLWNLAYEQKRTTCAGG